MERKADSVHDRKEQAEATNRRRHVRLPLKMPVRFHLEESPERDFRGRTQNMSDSGLMLVAGHSLPPGSAVSLRLLCSDREVTLEGDVVWSRPCKPHRAENGIQFRSPVDHGFAIQLFIREFLEPYSV